MDQNFNEKLPARFGLFLVFLFFAYARIYELPILHFLIPLQPTRLFMILAILGYLLSREKRLSVMKEKSWVWFFLMQVLALGLIPFSVWRGQSLDWFLETNLRILITFYLFLAAADSWKKFGALIKTIFISCFLVAIRVILAYRSGNFVFDSDGTKRVVGVGTLGSNDPNDLALVLAMAVPLGLYYWHTQKGFKKIFFGLLIGGLLSALVVTGSRGGYLGIGLGLAIFYGCLYRKRKLKYIAVMVLLVLIAGLVMPAQYKARFLSTFDESDYTRVDERHGRVAVWKRSWKAMWKRPIGYGLKNASIAEGEQKSAEGMQGKWMVTHNSYLQIGLEIGVLGLVFFLLFLWSGFANIKKTLGLCRGPDDREYEVMACALAGGLGAFLVSSFFLSQAYYWNQYIFIALTVGLRRVVEQEHGAQSAENGSREPRGVHGKWKSGAMSGKLTNKQWEP